MKISMHISLIYINMMGGRKYQVFVHGVLIEVQVNVYNVSFTVNPQSKDENFPKGTLAFLRLALHP